MTGQQIALACRLEEHPRWVWKQGMKSYLKDVWVGRIHQRLPDLSDYNTAAILLRMAMEAGPIRYAVRRGEWWKMGGWKKDTWLDTDNDAGISSDLGVCAARALLAAWGEL